MSLPLKTYIIAAICQYVLAISYFLLRLLKLTIIRFLLQVTVEYVGKLLDGQIVDPMGIVNSNLVNE